MSKPNAHGRPPDDLRLTFKHYQGLTREALDQDGNIVSGQQFVVNGCSPKVIRTIDKSTIQFGSDDQIRNDQITTTTAAVLEWPDLPGLHYIPGLLSEETQIQLLSRLLHRDLINPQHQTNIHKHYKISYEAARSIDDTSDEDETASNKSFFNADPKSATAFQPRDPTVHKSLTMAQFLNKKLRWVTLGGQYDWTEKVYPDEKPPDFPADIAGLIRKGFPEMEPQAAIVNVYSPGDTLALHRDVSEVSDNGLVSISLGCEAVFVVGREVEGSHSMWRAFLLRSGDAVYMSGASRYAWHGVPKIFRETCPKGLQAWPAGSGAGKYEKWRNWMAGKRVNLNVRQMFDQDVTVRSV